MQHATCFLFPGGDWSVLPSIHHLLIIMSHDASVLDANSDLRPALILTSWLFFFLLCLFSDVQLDSDWTTENITELMLHMWLKSHLIGHESRGWLISEAHLTWNYTEWVHECFLSCDSRQTQVRLCMITWPQNRQARSQFSLSGATICTTKHQHCSFQIQFSQIMITDDHRLWSQTVTYYGNRLWPQIMIADQGFRW